MCDTVIETARLYLRHFRNGDEYDLFEYLSEPEVNCFRQMKTDDLAQAQKAVEERIGNKNEEFFAVCLKETGKVIGEVFYCRDKQEDDTVSPCWMFNKKFQVNGYAYEAASALLDYLFGNLSVRRIYAYTEDYNFSCQRLCEKLGMRREGLFREFVSFINNPDGSPKYENTIQYAILRKEWAGRRAGGQSPRYGI